MGPVRQNPIQRTVRCVRVCALHCAQLLRTILQNRPDNFPSYPPDSHHCFDDVYLMEGGCLTMPSQTTCASALPGKTGKDKNDLFHSNAVLVYCMNSTSCFISSVFYDSRLIFMLLYDSPNLAINVFSSGLLGAWFRVNEVESAAEVGQCCTHNALVRCLLGFPFRKVMQTH